MNRQDIASALREMGLKNGDKILLHSSLLSLGKVDGGPDAVIDAFLDVIGKEGTLVLPVFGALGVLTEVFKARKDAVISPAPVGTVAAVGADAEALCRDHWQAETAHGKDTPYTRLAEIDGYVCLLGVDQDRNTSLHSVEALLELPYLCETARTFTLPDGREITKSWKYYPGPHRDFIGIDRYYREAGVMQIRRIGNSQVRLIKSKDLLEIGMEIGKKDPAFVLCDNPACADCVKQRAAIYADRIAKESFRLSASSRLAGRYVPEMIENLLAAGIKEVELDYIQGKACAFMTPEKVQKIASEFNESGISISALSVEIVPNDPAILPELVKAANTSRIILPVGAVEAAKLAVENGVTVAFRNSNQTALNVSAAINDFIKTTPAGACFNPAAFTKAGECPFLNSYRKGRFVKIISQLDIVDSLWDGTLKPLARGNGEIKELMSILRCHNFSGYFCLGGGCGYPGTLKEAADAMLELLENM